MVQWMEIHRVPLAMDMQQTMDDFATRVASLPSLEPLPRLGGMYDVLEGLTKAIRDAGFKEYAKGEGSQALADILQRTQDILGEPDLEQAVRHGGHQVLALSSACFAIGSETDLLCTRAARNVCRIGPEYAGSRVPDERWTSFFLAWGVTRFRYIPITPENEELIRVFSEGAIAFVQAPPGRNGNRILFAYCFVLQGGIPNQAGDLVRVIGGDPNSPFDRYRVPFAEALSRTVGGLGDDLIFKVAIFFPDVAVQWSPVMLRAAIRGADVCGEREKLMHLVRAMRMHLWKIITPCKDFREWGERRGVKRTAETIERLFSLGFNAREARALWEVVDERLRTSMYNPEEVFLAMTPETQRAVAYAVGATWMRLHTGFLPGGLPWLEGATVNDFVRGGTMPSEDDETNDLECMLRGDMNLFPEIDDSVAFMRGEGGE